MRVLLDECLPRGLKKHLQPHAVVTVPEAGWAGKKNGDLLRTANGSIDVFVNIDKNGRMKFSKPFLPSNTVKRYPSVAN